jgi:hypothetical protein
MCWNHWEKDRDRKQKRKVKGKGEKTHRGENIQLQQPTVGTEQKTHTQTNQASMPPQTPVRRADNKTHLKEKTPSPPRDDHSGPSPSQLTQQFIPPSSTPAAASATEPVVPVLPLSSMYKITLNKDTRERANIQLTTIPVLSFETMKDKTLTILASRASFKFTDLDALVAAERPHVRAALFKATRIQVICYHDKNPLIIFHDIKEDVIKGSLKNRTDWILPTNPKQQVIEGLELPTGPAYLLQTKSPITELEAAAKYFLTNGRHNYLVNETPINIQGACVMPLDAITASKYRRNMATIVYSNGTTADRNIEHISSDPDVRGVAKTGVNSVRILFSKMPSEFLMKRFCNGDVKAVKLDLSTQGWGAETARDIMKRNQREKLDDKHLFVTDHTGQPVAKTTAEKIAKHFNAAIVHMSALRVILKLPENAQHLHATLINGRYFLSSPTAEAEEAYEAAGPAAEV